MKMFLSILFHFAILQPSLKAQQVLDKYKAPTEYYVNVKQFGEFAERFNYKINWMGKPIDSIFARKVSRADYIRMLFNQTDPKFSAENLKNSTLINDFITSVTNSSTPTKISLYTGSILAEAQLNISYLGKQSKAIVYLIPSIADDRSMKWIISKVIAPQLIPQADTLSKYFIAPNSHETSFINIKKISTIPDPLYFAAPQYNTDATILFFVEIATKKLTINNIEKVRFQVYFPEYVITVEEFVRETMNSGWLISNLEKKQSNVSEFLKRK